MAIITQFLLLATKFRPASSPIQIVELEPEVINRPADVPINVHLNEVVKALPDDDPNAQLRSPKVILNNALEPATQVLSTALFVKFPQLNPK